MAGKYTCYQLFFSPVTERPDADVTLLCTDGFDVEFGYYDGSQEIPWRRLNDEPWLGVKAWAEPPDPVECMLDCYPEHDPVWREVSREGYDR